MVMRFFKWLGIRIVAMLGDYYEAGPVRLKLWDIFLKYFPGHITCEQFENFVHDYHEGLLPEKQLHRFEFHLKICPMCESSFKSYVRTVELTGHLFDEKDSDVPDEVPQELINAMLAARQKD